MGYVLGLQEIDRAQIAVVGGKGANLGELSRIDGIQVPDGFCVTTDAFRRVIADVPSLDDRLEQLSQLEPENRETIRIRSEEIRYAIEESVIPEDVATEVVGALARFGNHAYAVRSSATAEDLPNASFAGQQDTYLNIIGPESILQHVRRCWGSLFTERAVTYRLRNGFDQRKVHMAVIVQRMVLPQAAGTLVTADPITSHRKVSSVQASVGLGEAVVSGLVNTDVYTVRDGEVTARTIATKQLAIEAVPAGGTQTHEIEQEQQSQPALTDAQAVQLEQLGRKIEAHFGSPQDIEWCLVDDGFRIVQSRAITTLFPIPVASDRDNRVYVSVAHQQMMTDPIKPLGISVWQLTSPAAMREAGARLFVDVTEALAAPTSRAEVMDALSKSDPLIGDALQSVLDRADFIRWRPDGDSGPVPTNERHAPIENDAAIVAELIARKQTALAALQRDIRARAGVELLDFIDDHIQQLGHVMFDSQSQQVIIGAMEASSWINDQLQEWLGEKNAADTLTQSVSHNVTSEMGLELLDVADAIRPHPEVVAFLQHVEDMGFDDGNFLDELAERTGGRKARAAIESYLDKYGMRCVGEIDITRPRWSEYPTMLVPPIMGNIRNFEPGAATRRFEQGRREAKRKEQEVLERLRTLPDGERKATETKQMIDRVRTFSGYREYPKYIMVGCYFEYKQAMLREAEHLVRANVLSEQEDIFYLHFDELRELVHTYRACDQLIDERKDTFRSYQALTPPRVLTSDGETITGAYRRDDVPDGALTGIPVSVGVVEGRARVVSDIARADLEPSDILVTAYTDPSWTPLFVTIKGLVTEVGGLMTHGAVIAREYGLPAVVGVERATELIRDGRQIRVHGTDGYVEVLPQQTG